MFSKRVTTDRTGKLYATGKVFHRKCQGRPKVAQGRDCAALQTAPCAGHREGHASDASGDDTSVFGRHCAWKRFAACGSSDNCGGDGNVGVAGDTTIVHNAICIETAAPIRRRHEMSSH